jgi:tetratricopeptide (TPR) repeat protein
LIAYDGRVFRQIRPDGAQFGKITALLPTSTGRILFGTEKAGVLEWDGTNLREFHNSLASIAVTALAGDDADLWVGTLDRGLLHWNAGSLTSLNETLPDRRVLALVKSSETVYAGTALGVAEIQNGSVARVLAQGYFAQALHAADDNAEALVAINRALDLDPDHGPAHFTHGLIAVHTDPVAAAFGFRRAAELRHQPLQATTNRATCLAMVGRRDEALQILEHLTTDHPEFAEGWYSLGLARVKLGHHSSAIVALGRAISLDPDHANAHYARACAHALQAEPNRSGADQALADIARAVAIEPGLRAAIRDDADFEALAGHPEFHRLTAAEPVPGPGSAIRN